MIYIFISILTLYILNFNFYITSSESPIETNRCISLNSAISNQINSKQNSNKKTSWAIVALTKPGKTDLSIRNSAIAQRIRNYSHLYDFTIIFFSEKTFSSNEINEWTKTFDGIAKVKLINTESNGFNLKERYGYKYMCKFFALDIYSYLKEYDYYMRIDSDCYLKSLTYDIFSWIETSKIEYGYALRKLEAHGPTKQTLPTWTHKYLQKCDIKAKSLMDRPLTTCFNFYNNFHIGKVSFFMREDVQHYLHSVNQSGHILNDRWGDSSIQAYAVRIFLQPCQIGLIPNFSYVHGSHDKLVSSFGDGSKSEVPQQLPHWNCNKVFV